MTSEQPKQLVLKKKQVPGGPQNVQLSLNGKRLETVRLAVTLQPGGEQHCPSMCNRKIR